MKNASRASAPTRITVNNRILFFLSLSMITDVCLSISDPALYPVSDVYAEAKRNGWEAVAIPSAGPEDKDVLSCIRIHADSAKELQSRVRSAPKHAFVIADARDNSFNRFALTQNGVSFLAGLENLPKGGFDHIAARLAAEKNTGLVIELSAIIDYKTRRSALSSYADCLALQRKYQFPLVIASGAKTPYGIRNLKETEALCSLFGMTRAEVYHALNAADAVLHPKKILEVVE